LGLLASSFAALWFYAFQMFRAAFPKLNLVTYFGLLTLPVYSILVSVDVIMALAAGQITLYQLTGSLVRYLLAVPGAAFAALGLHARADFVYSMKRIPLNRYLDSAALGFALYSLTQLFVPEMTTVLAGWVSAEAFFRLTGLPIQLVRTVAGIWITSSLFFSTQFLEKERQQELSAAQQARLEAVQQQEALRRAHLRHIVRAQEDERARIARELHDEMAQTLTGFTLNLAALGQTSLNPESHSILRNLQDLGRQMSQDIQRLVYTLRPAHLDELGLVKALEALSDRMSGSLQLEIKLKIDGPAIRLPQILETALFRIAQEALTNVSRHAQTRQVWIEISYQPEWVCLSVRDAGVGFQAPEDFSSLSGWGLVGIRERVESVGGQFKLTSRPGEGTSLEVKAPINLNQEDVHAGHSDTAR
jgi:signal transduction histidine kinase